MSNSGTQYPGNASIAPEIRKRIETTFNQTLDLAAKGSRQEALVGCDFVLRMDPEFEPARMLQQRLNSGTGEMQIEDLRPESWQAAADGPSTPGTMPLSADTGPELSLGSAPLADSGLRGALEQLLAQRNFKRLLEVADENRDEVHADPALREVLEQARSKMEAEPYIESFLASAKQAEAAGRGDEAAQLLQKAKALDPDHPAFAPAGGGASLDSTRAADLGAPLDLGNAPSLGDSEVSLSSLGSAPAATGDARIDELLDEGQAAFDQGDYQGAIDSWSRIFLVDIDNDEAARRIEEARKLRAEKERQVEEVFHEGLAHLDEGDQENARLAFERVLILHPSHQIAREYLEKMDAGDPVGGTASGTASAAPQGGDETIGALDFDEPGMTLREEILTPPEPGAPPPDPSAASESEPRKSFSMSGKSSQRKRGLLVGAAVMAVVLIGGWFGLQQWDRLFPNSEPEEIAPVRSVDPITRATRQYEDGRIEAAIRVLRGVSVEHERFTDAQELIAQWEAELAGPEEEEPTLSAERIAEREDHLEQAMAALDRGANLVADQHFRAAERIAPLIPSEDALHAEAKSNLQPLLKQITLFQEREWELVLPELWQIRETDPGNLDVERLIVDSYYNLGVRELQRGDAAAASERLAEAARLRPGDTEVERHLTFARAYSQRSKDLLYRIYIKYLPFR